jgi:hypothetical protein
VDGDHEYVAAPLAVSVTELPAQMDADDGLMLITPLVIAPEKPLATVPPQPEDTFT